jgi:hypothetical protein
MAVHPLTRTALLNQGQTHVNSDSRLFTFDSHHTSCILYRTTIIIVQRRLIIQYIQSPVADPSARIKKSKRAATIVPSHHQTARTPFGVRIHRKRVLRADQARRHVAVVVCRIARKLGLVLLAFKSAFGTHCRRYVNYT